ncbi:hypothetical protein R9C00_06215 [Flammeovirgaceae bacterium SG7u.111]|nr:hypothetical protein [Flammeovirgaceae bacterium SG7u.132]WPO37036.1 hypothetical protein R9C00_06215 [Flammeovirgaceae bacterium SG7u.111]
MKMKNLFFALAIFLAMISCQSNKTSDDSLQIRLSVEPALAQELDYPLGKLKSQLTQQGVALELTDAQSSDAQLSLSLISPKEKEPNDGFELLKNEEGFSLSSECSRGLLYGLLEIANQLESGSKWSELAGKK